MYIIKSNEIFTEDGVVSGSVLIKNDKIDSINADSQEAELIDLTGLKLIPGFIDIHVHGGNGADTMDLTIAALEKMSTFKLKEGVTSFCPTTVTTSLEKTKSAIETVRLAMKQDMPGAKILGSFLEGPYIHAKFRGAHPEEFIRDISLEEIKDLIDYGKGTVMSFAIAPDKENATEAIDYLTRAGVNVRIGHSAATCEQAIAAIENGASIAIHTFNAMSPFTHREPGMVGAVLLNDDIYNEIICDLVHSHPRAMQLLFKCKGADKVILITDCMSAGGLEDGNYMLGELPVKVENSIARTMNGALAGSTLSLLQAIKNAYQSVGVSLEDAIKMATITPARALGQDATIGSIKPGKQADLIAIDNEFNIKFIMVNGKIL